MGRKKDDGKGRLGGRAKGTPNKISGTVKEWLQAVIDNNRGRFEKDLSKLNSGERVRVISNLLPFVVPKLQATNAEELLEAEYRKLEEFLDTAPDEAIDEIVKRISRLKDESRGTATED